jgi:hypothetical protein
MLIKYITCCCTRKIIKTQLKFIYISDTVLWKYVSKLNFHVHVNVNSFLQVTNVNNFFEVDVRLKSLIPVSWE